MAEFKLPVDYERLPEFRLLVDEVKALKSDNDCRGCEVQTASYLISRLFVDLSYLAQQTNQPGLLTVSGASLFVASLCSAFSTDRVLPMLSRAGLLTPRGEEYFCERFARHNEHLAGDHVSGVHRGAARSALVRQKHQIAAEANHQAMLLPETIWRDKSGLEIPAHEINQLMTEILTLDRILKRPARHKSEFSEGLVADALEVVRRHAPEQLQSFHYWLLDVRDKSVIPKTAEQILARWGELIELMGAK